eukprot:CAMPEP_0116889426 /NCGR_PEP_ID=MMETSP0463-20121206/24898_1 /TAXON_ID=181622 /ORGANISM="Strombidinopsis sp, Strain SopsisLIS2011" /LENGTH=70 /DNA_ID=CAMNT_0004556079 /DNA_START=225 /DNA_END=437 /DNA_ORIENTATION=+
MYSKMWKNPKDDTLFTEITLQKVISDTIDKKNKRVLESKSFQKWILETTNLSTAESLQAKVQSEYKETFN